MTKAEFLQLITTKRARHVLKALSVIPEADRRAFAPIALKTQKAYDKAYWDAQFNGRKQTSDLAKDGDALGVAILATARPSEYSCGDWRILPRSIPLTDVFSALNLSWIDDWAVAAVEDNPRLIEVVHALYAQGQCNIPQTDAYILGYYAHQAAVPELARDQFLTHDVWRFFEVEGGGDLSLAAHDKYVGRGVSWAEILISLSDDGTLDRDRLLDASLDALERDFGQFRAGWYSRFHTSLCPTDAEILPQAGRYLNLLASSVPPTVVFALKVLKRIDKLHGIDPAALLASIEPALQGRQKSSAVMALQLLKNCAKRHPDRASNIALMAASALISEAGDVQARALDLIETLGQHSVPEVQDKLRDYVDMVAPTVQGRLSEIVGGGEPTPLPDAADPVVRIDALHPVASVEEAVAVFLELLEDGSDPFLTERAFDGLARFGAAAGPLLSPLAKRATQLSNRVVLDAFGGAGNFEKPILATALAWANGTGFDAELQPFLTPRYSGHTPLGINRNSFEGMFAARAQELLALVREGHAIPMLSAPSDNRGYLSANQLIDRLAEYQKIGVQPGDTDFKLALMRLAPEGREAALNDLQPQSEPERALAYALGADAPPEADKQLWAIAWSSTLPLRPDPHIENLIGGSVPGAGHPARFEFYADIRRIDQYTWPRPKIRITPPILDNVDAALGFALPAKSEHTYMSDPGSSWMVLPNPWVGLARPAHTELFFATGIFELDLDQKLTNHHCLMFLDPLFRPDPKPGAMAHAMLAWYLASADEGIGTTTIDAMATLMDQHVFDPSAFTSAAHSLVFHAGLPLRRWTKRLTQVAGTSDAHARAVKSALAGMMVDLPSELPRDLGGILELLYELCVASDEAVGSPDTQAALRSIEAGGKTGKFARKLAVVGQTVN
ncbi:DUF6493 family protein [Ruegeria arenilitoris]|uniref:DUF6493 family protein n=1 Tax=Ruegeria arenilitoris TaxID=1173585 RepID=UPI00147F792C|nr:DUF6493 family protein [Ruegeria arenilitoris]